MRSTARATATSSATLHGHRGRTSQSGPARAGAAAVGARLGVLHRRDARRGADAVGAQGLLRGEARVVGAAAQRTRPEARYLPRVASNGASWHGLAARNGRQ